MSFSFRSAQEANTLHQLLQRAGPPGGPPGGLPPGNFTPPPPGQLTDYCDLKFAGLWDGPEPNNGPAALAALWSLFGAATVFTALRFYCKIGRNRGPGLWWDDLFMGVTWLCFLTTTILCNRVISHGFGKYPCDIPFENFRILRLEGDNLAASFAMMAMMWSKTAFAVVLLRLTHGRLKWLVWFTILSVNILMGVAIILMWVKCTPVASNWDMTIQGYCWDPKYINITGVFAGCLSGFCDILLSLLPWTLIWNLRMRKREKVGIGIAMSMGIFAGITSFVKSATIMTFGGKNFTHDGTALLVWQSAEISTAMMATSIPTLRVLFRDLHGHSRVEEDLPSFVMKNGTGSSGTKTGMSFTKTQQSELSYHEMIRTDSTRRLTDN